MNSVCSWWVIILTCFLFLTGQIVFVDHTYAQSYIKIRGTVLDGRSRNSIPNAKIQLPKNKIFVADFNGKFKFSCLPEDSFVITALGYSPRLLIVHDLLADSSKCNVFMQPFFHQLRPVVVTAEKRKSKVVKALNFLADMSHPFTYFSREETLKRRHAKIKSSSVYFSQNIYWQINRQLIAEISKLSGEDLDTCIIFCNTHIVLSSYDDELSVTNKLLLLISDYFKRTKSENRDSLNKSN